VTFNGTVSTACKTIVSSQVTPARAVAEFRVKHFPVR
jgi:hypothetical protein